MDPDKITLLKAFTTPQSATTQEPCAENEDLATYEPIVILQKAREGIALLKKQSWPPNLHKSMIQLLESMQKDCKNIECGIKKGIQSESLRIAKQTDFWQKFEKVIETLEKSYITESNQEECQKSFQEYILQEHDRHYHDVLTYRNSLQTLCNPRGPRWADPHLDTISLLKHYETTISEKRRTTTLKSLALQIAFDAAQSHSSHPKEFIQNLRKVNWRAQPYIKISEKDRMVLENECVKLLKYLGKDSSHLLQAADRAAVQASNHWLWMKNRLRYLEGKKLPSSDYSPSAILEYLSFLVDRIIPLSFASAARKSIVFSNTVQNMHEYTQNWQPQPKNSR
jgi:hypothetical protein